MALSCPRCGTDVPSESLYCPYCSLPRPKRGFSEVDDKPEALVAEAVPAVTVRKIQKDPVQQKQRHARKRSSWRSGRPGKEPRRLRVSVLSIAALVAVCGIGAYIFVVPMVYSEKAEPKAVLAALDRLRKTQSSEPGLTIDARLSRQLETARRVGNLVSYQGWVVKPIKGSKTKVVFAYSFQEVGNVSQDAEWIADLTNGTFTPQTDQAAAVVNPRVGHEIVCGIR
jgi:hypothetical protein